MRSALEASKALASGDLSAAELMQETLARIDAVNPALNAIVSLAPPEVLMAEARAADASPRRGWLHGMPVAVKDLSNAAGFPTSKGSPLLAGQVAERDDLHVARLRAAGAIVIGKTNTPEFGLGSHTFNPVHGATVNPYAPDRTCGGSSGGAAVALAAGMLDVADGSDMMGSLRNPAGWNNVYGMRPTWGLVPPEPQGELYLHRLSTNGPMARDPWDLAALLDTMAGPDARSPLMSAQPGAAAALEGGPRAARIGWLGDWGGAFAYEPGILDLAAQALATLTDLGCTIEETPPPFSRDALWESWTGLRAFSVAASLAPLAATPAAAGALKDTAQWEIAKGQALTAMDLERLSQIRSDWFRTVLTLFETVDVLAIPTAQVWPFPTERAYPTEIAGQAMDSYHRWMECMVPASLIGLPAVAVPMGFGGPDDLPMGLQLIGPPGSDGRLLQVAALWHEGRGRTDRPLRI